MASGVGAANFCDLPRLAGPHVCELPGVVEGAAGAANAAVETAQFMHDPFGYIAERLQGAAAELADAVLPNLEAVTHPELDREWFISTYRVSFALALLVFVAFLGWNFLALGRRRITSDELMETLAFYVPLFLGGAMFGPAIGQFLLSFTGALTNSVMHWGFGGGSTSETTTRLQEVIAAGNPDAIAGGAVVSILLFFAMVIGLLMVFAVLVVMLVTLYLTGAILPLSLVWLVHPHRRGRGLKLVAVWVGICFSHVLLFLLLGAAFKMVSEFMSVHPAGGGPGEGGIAAAPLQALVNLVVAVIALFMATLAPFKLLRFAPVGPTAGGSGPSLPLPAQRGRGGGRPIGGYPESATASQLAQAARANPGVIGGGPRDDGRNGWGLQPRGNGLAERYAAERQARGGGTATATDPGTANHAAETETTPGGGTGSGSPAAGAPVPATPAPNSTPATGSAAGGGGTPAPGGAAPGGAAAAPSGAAAGGGGAAAGGSAGAGAAAPAGLGLAALGGAARAAGAAGDMAGDQMEHGDGPEGLHPPRRT